jgi:hypothetical protein
MLFQRLQINYLYERENKMLSRDFQIVPFGQPVMGHIINKPNLLYKVAEYRDEARFPKPLFVT